MTDGMFRNTLKKTDDMEPYTKPEVTIVCLAMESTSLTTASMETMNVQYDEWDD